MSTSFATPNMSRSQSPSAEALQFGESCLVTASDVDGDGSDSQTLKRQRLSMTVVAETLLPLDTNAVGGSAAAFAASPQRKTASSRIVEETQEAAGVTGDKEDEDEDHDDCVIVGSIPQEWIARNDFLCPLLYNLTLCSSQQ